VLNIKLKGTSAKLAQLQNDYIDLMQSCLTGCAYQDFSQDPFSSGGFDLNRRNYGLDWPSQAQTMIGTKRMVNLRTLVESVIADNIPGDFIETGVWRGGACIFMRAILYTYDIPDRRVWVADSFEGLPSPNGQKYPADIDLDFHIYDELKVGLEQVKDNFRAYGLLDEQVKFLKGWFKDSLPQAPIDQLALIRLDGDMYESTMDALSNLYPKLSHRGYVIVDDYHVVKACRGAVHDYCDNHGIEPNITEIDGVGVFWRKFNLSEQSSDVGVSFPQGNKLPDIEINRLNEALIKLNKNVIRFYNESLSIRNNEIESLSQELLEKNKNNESLTQQNESLTQQNESLTQQNESLTQKVDWVKSELKKASDINEQLIDELNKVYASNSWRVTKFLRYLRRL